MTASAKNAFTDLAGRRWLLKLNYGLAQRINEALSVDLANAHQGRVFQQLGGDALLFIQTLTMLIDDQLSEQKVTPEQFVEALDDVVLDQASEALREMIVLFTRPAIRPVLTKMFDKSDQAKQRALAMATQRLDSPEVDAAIERELAALDQTLATSSPAANSLAASSTDINLPTNGPESAAVIPSATASAN